MGNAIDRLKNIGLGTLGFGMWILLIVLAVLMIIAAEWIGLKALPYLYAIDWVCLGLTLLVLLPLACVRKTRFFAAQCMVYSSFVYGITLWFLGLILTGALWGGGAQLLGLFLLGIGCVPFAMLATFFKGMWSALAVLVFLTILTFGIRFLGIWLLTKIPDEYEFVGDYGKKVKRPLLLVGIIAAILLLLALFDMPYGYFTFLRLAVCIASIVVIVFNYTHNRYWASCIWGLIAVLFNPVILVHIDRDLWQIIDFVCAGLFIYAGIAFWTTTETQEMNKY